MQSSGMEQKMTTPTNLLYRGLPPMNSAFSSITGESDLMINQTTLRFGVAQCLAQPEEPRPSRSKPVRKSAEGGRPNCSILPVLDGLIQTTRTVIE